MSRLLRVQSELLHAPRLRSDSADRHKLFQRCQNIRKWLAKETLAMKRDIRDVDRSDGVDRNAMWLEEAVGSIGSVWQPNARESGPMERLVDRHAIPNVGRPQINASRSARSLRGVRRG